MIRPDVKLEFFGWARDRSGLAADALYRRFPKLKAWEQGEAKPTLKQLEAFVRATFVPVGYFFLERPPIEALPIPDFRSGRGRRGTAPSPNLLDTVYVCQQRQEWYRDFARSTGEK